MTKHRKDEDARPMIHVDSVDEFYKTDGMVWMPLHAGKALRTLILSPETNLQVISYAIHVMGFLNVAPLLKRTVGGRVRAH